MKAAILAIDLGSSAVKAAVVDDAGALLGAGAAAIDLLVGEDGAAEQNPEQLWRAVMEACATAVRGASAEIVGLSCSSQYSSVIPVDGAGEALTNLILWRDTRGARHARALIEGKPGSRQTWIDIHGLAPSPEGLLLIYQGLRCALHTSNRPNLG